MPLFSNLGHESRVLQSLPDGPPEAPDNRRVAHQDDARIESCGADRSRQTALYCLENMARRDGAHGTCCTSRPTVSACEPCRV